MDVGAQFLDAVLVAGDEILPALGGQFRDAVEPARVELGALVVAQEILAGDAVAFGEPHQAALVADEPLVDVVELLDQRIDARLIKPQRLHLLDDVFLELLRLALLRRRQRLVLELALDVELLQAAQPLERVGDVVERLQHFGLELGLDGRKRHRVFEIVLVEVGVAERRFFAASSPSARGRRRSPWGLERRGAVRRRRRRHRLHRLRHEARRARRHSAGRHLDPMFGPISGPMANGSPPGGTAGATCLASGPA